ncbi:hypothetical protein AURDEDRAFT_159372 [Auricularia subglabra TFB-10046 SS5]|nr:hypothetical protein AURDEDRAFT_159372 [Auricularia subglabra TFB-10046 SS5]
MYRKMKAITDKNSQRPTKVQEFAERRLAERADCAACATGAETADWPPAPGPLPRAQPAGAGNNTLDPDPYVGLLPADAQAEPGTRNVAWCSKTAVCQSLVPVLFALL